MAVTVHLESMHSTVSSLRCFRSPQYDSSYTAPPQNIIPYEPRVFDELGTLTKYHGPPTDETDEAWDALTACRAFFHTVFDVSLIYRPIDGLTRITNVEADRIENRTTAIPGDEGHNLIVLDVFHQLHCLVSFCIMRYSAPHILTGFEQNYRIASVKLCRLCATHHSLCYHLSTQVDRSSTILTIA